MSTIERKNKQQLREKASRLPLSPGVYIMRSHGGKVIYVGKSKALKNRVTQYFQDTSKGVKTEAMVAHVYDFDYMLTNTEIEALALENKLIKLYQPKYNILLKDGKNYPYIKLNLENDYPTVELSRKRISDKARYFGPYSSAKKAYTIINTVNQTFMLPSCKRVFPRDIGKERPCLYKDIGRCCGICAGDISSDSYKERMPDVINFLKGNIGDVKCSLEKKMKDASASLAFEAAALYRDRIKALTMLWDKQMVIGKPDDEFDIVSIYKSDLSSCIAVYYVRGGAVIDSDNFVFGAEKIIEDADITSFLCELYQKREYIPSNVFLDLNIGTEQINMISEFVNTGRQRSISFRVPIRGDHKKMCELVAENAKNHALQYIAEAQKDNEILLKLSQTLSLEIYPETIEAIDISNYGNESITAGIIALKNGKFNKQNYRLYKIRTIDYQNDYGAMREAVERRIERREENPLPDLFLLDGGKAHVSVIRELLMEKGADMQVFGMVKDDFHKTRAITDGENEISISRDQALYTFIYKIQEEVHRFSIKASSSDKRKKLKHSSLEDIDGIGAAKARILLEHFKSIKAIKSASLDEIASVKGISRANAEQIYNYYNE